MREAIKTELMQVIQAAALNPAIRFAKADEALELLLSAVLDVSAIIDDEVEAAKAYKAGSDAIGRVLHALAKRNVRRFETGAR